ncbi:MAG: NAD-dependent epimerase/dehydratase family protein [Verrucomicrobiae bacterium]|nr:NAD-dependent epimerase/dehydratase family protein [Verrucomicrobiae bacterium]
MQHLLITGGAGFIGSHLASAACHAGCRVRVLDDLSSGRAANLSGLPVEVCEGSVLNPERVRRAMDGVTVVVHLAAFVSVAASMESPEACVGTNVLGTLHVLHAAASAGVGRLVFASSAAVYGDHPAPRKQESLPPDPRSPYALTKLDGEFYCGLYHGRNGLRTVVARFFNVYGPRQDPASPYAAAVPTFINRALAGEDLVIYGDGAQTRDLIAAPDIAAGLRHLVDHPGLEGVYNLGHGRGISIMELAETIVRKTGSRSRIRHEAARPGEVRHSIADVDRIRATGWSPEVELHEGLESTIGWLRSERRGV